MSDCFITQSANLTVIDIVPILANDFEKWLTTQPEFLKSWLKMNDFTAKSGQICLLPSKGGVDRVLIGVDDADDFWVFGNLPSHLSIGNYKISAPNWSHEQLQRALIAWCFGSYKFSKYKKVKPFSAKIVLPEGADLDYLKNITDAIRFAWYLIDMPSEDMGPKELAEEALKLSKKYKAKMKEVVGEKLLKKNFPAIYAVGKGGNRAPRIIDITWGNKKKAAYSLTLVGKGVCFDSGGLCLKPEKGMSDMKKDMAGAAHALGLARMIMQGNLPIYLRVIIPVVENLISGASYKPGDVITARNGKTIEVANTDAEGRLILADALSLASEDKPDLLIDFASLTGAARVALGLDITAMLTDDEKLAQEFISYANQEKEPLWRLPLFKNYRQYLDSEIADLGNIANASIGGGAITAALFLKEFVAPGIPWVHFDLAAWNGKSGSQGPRSGEVYCLRGLYNYLRKRALSKS